MKQISAAQGRAAGPAIALVTVLTIGAVVTWSVVLGNTSTGSTGTACPPPTAQSAGAAGASQQSNALDETAPAPPGAVRIRVLNGGDQRGQANLVASQLGELGFTEVAEATNDPLYPNGDLACRGNIRYGERGAAAARTVSLVLPCVALQRDNRQDDSVDVSVGTLFGEVSPTKAAREALDQLGGPAGQTNVTDGGAAPTADPELLTQARDVAC